MFPKAYLQNWWKWSELMIFMFLTFQSFGNGERILLVPMQFPSKTLEQVHVGEELVRRGHDVYCLLANRTEHLHRITDKGIKVINFQYPENTPLASSKEYHLWLSECVFKKRNEKEIWTMEADREFQECWFMMKDARMLEEVKKLMFDLAIADGSRICPCYFTLPEYLHLPFVGMFDDAVSWWTGVPALPSLVASSDIGLYQRFWRLVNFIFRHTQTGWSSMLDIPMMDLLKHYVPSAQTWGDLYSRGQFYIVTRDHHLEAPMPAMPNMIYLPGISAGPSAALTGDVADIVLASNEDIVLVSFGSTTTYLPSSIIILFLDAFRDLKETVIWKMPRLSKDLEEFVPQNVHLLSWIPQNDLLGHCKIKVFITHCGNNGQYEAVYHGVPMLGFPLFIDQPGNARRMAAKGLGIPMDIHNFTASDLRDNVLRLLHNDSYRNTALKYSRMLKARKMLPKQEAAYWVEHVLEFGGQHLRPHSIDMPWYAFFALDILALLLFLILVVLGGTSYGVLVTMRYCLVNGRQR